MFMKQTTILKMVAQNFGLSAKDVLEDWLQDGWLKLEDVQAILPEIVSGSSKVRHNQSKRKELKKSDICNISDLKENVAFEPTILCGMAKSEKIEVGMFYYAEGKIFSTLLQPDKSVSGVVAYVDDSGLHGVVWLLHGIYSIWSDQHLFVNMPVGLSGKENTRKILQASKNQHIRAYAAKYCAQYDFDGVQAGEAFLPSIEELRLIHGNQQLVNEKLALIKGAKLLPKGRCWSSSEMSCDAACTLNFSSGEESSIFKYKRRIYVGSCVAF